MDVQRQQVLEKQHSWVAGIATSFDAPRPTPPCADKPLSLSLSLCLSLSLVIASTTIPQHRQDRHVTKYKLILCCGHRAPFLSGCVDHRERGGSSTASSWPPRLSRRRRRRACGNTRRTSTRSRSASTTSRSGKGRQRKSICCEAQVRLFWPSAGQGEVFRPSGAVAPKLSALSSSTNRTYRCMAIGIIVVQATVRDKRIKRPSLPDVKGTADDVMDEEEFK